MPFGCALRLNKFQPGDVKMGEPIYVGGVLLKPTHPEDLDILSPGPASNVLCAFIVDGDCKDVNEMGISIRVGVIIFSGSNYDIRSCAEVDNV
jgi:hypothetical protein